MSSHKGCVCGTTFSFQCLFDLFYMFSERNHHTTATLVLIMYFLQYPIIQDLHLCLDSQFFHSTDGKHQKNNSVNKKAVIACGGSSLSLQSVCHQFTRTKKKAEVILRFLFGMSTEWRQLSRRNVSKSPQLYFRVYQIYKIREHGDKL